VRICLIVDGNEPVFIYCEGQPRPGDAMRLPGSLFKRPEDEVEVVTDDLPSTWKPDDDGVLVPTYQATIR